MTGSRPRARHSIAVVLALCAALAAGCHKDPDLAGMATPDQFDAGPPRIHVEFCGQRLRSNARQVYCHEKEVEDLGPLESFSELSWLELGGTSVRDLRPLAHLRKLVGLVLPKTNVSDLSPLAGLRRLKTLDVSFTDVQSLEPLRGLAKLRRFAAISARIADLSPLAALPALEALQLRSNPIEDIRPLAGLHNLRELGLNCTYVRDIEPLLGLPPATTIDLYNTRVSAADCERFWASAPDRPEKQCRAFVKYPKGLTHEDLCMRGGKNDREQRGLVPDAGHGSEPGQP